MSPARKRFKVWKINLVQQPGWKPWDPGGEIAEKAFDLTTEFMRGMKAEDEYYSLVLGMVGDLLKPRAESGPQEWSPRGQILNDDVRLIAHGLQERKPGLELTLEVIEMAATWMYETALMPSDRDTRDALLDAKHAALENFDLGEMPDPWDLGYDNLWAPLLETGNTLSGILSEMMGTGIFYLHNEGQYDRFLEFDLNNSNSPTMLLEEIPRKDWGWVIRAIAEEWKRLSERIVEQVFLILTKDMKNIDVSNRTSWRESWKTTLKATDLSGARKEMLEYIRDIRKQEGSLL